MLVRKNRTMGNATSAPPPLSPQNLRSVWTGMRGEWPTTEAGNRREYPPPPNQPPNCHEESLREHMISGVRLHEAPYTSEIGENDLKHGSCQLLGVLSFCHFGSHADFSSSDQPFFLARAIAASPLSWAHLAENEYSFFFDLMFSAVR